MNRTDRLSAILEEFRGRSPDWMWAAPPMTLSGATRLAIPGLMFDIEASAAD